MVIFNVNDANGDPVDNAEILIDNGAEGWWGYTWEGTAEIMDATAGTWPYTINAFGFEEYTGNITVVADEDLVVNVTLTSLPKYTVTFEVKNISGEPVEGAEVWLYPYGGYYYKSEGKSNDDPKMEYNANTNAQGVAVIEDVVEGEYEYSIDHMEEGWFSDYITIDSELVMPVEVELIYGY